MIIPKKHSWKWFLVLLVTSIIMVGVVFITLGILGHRPMTDTFAFDLMTIVIMLVFCNILISLMGFFGWFYMWSFTELALVIVSIVGAGAIYDNSGGWALFVAVYVLFILEGASLALGTILQIANYIINRRREEPHEGITATGAKIIGAYGAILSGLLVYFLIKG